MISATNLDVYVMIKVSAEVTESGSVTVPYRLLSSLVSHIQAIKTDLAWKEKEMEIRAGTIEARIETLPAEEFPGPLKASSNVVECDAEDFMAPFRMLDHAISTEGERYQLQGVNLAPNLKNKRHCDFVATDGRRVAIFYSKKKLTEDNIIIPRTVVNAMLKIQPKGDATMAIGEAVLAIKVGDFELQAKLVEGQYPNYRQVIPEKPDKFFICARKELIHAITTCAVFTDKMIPSISLTGKGKEIEVARPPKAKAMIMGSELGGQPGLKIFLQAQYVLDALNVLSGDEVKVECVDEKTPVMIQEENFLAVLAPIVKQASA
jgi:DNA polymerase-3 subunit beta